MTHRKLDMIWHQSGLQKLLNASHRSGGGNIVNDNPIGGFQYASTGFDNGDGDSGGDLFSHQGGNKYFFSSLSNSQKTISSLTGHRHGTLDYLFESKLKVLNPGIVSDVKINTVTIDNTPGQNFCTINMTSATPTLGMLFIIRAFKMPTAPEEKYYSFEREDMVDHAELSFLF